MFLILTAINPCKLTYLCKLCLDDSNSIQNSTYFNFTYRTLFTAYEFITRYGYDLLIGRL